MKNPPAFPASHMRKYHASRDKEIAIDHDGQEGMTLRDYFAAKAMPLLEWDTKSTNHQPAHDAYAIADAMLKAREQ